MKKEKSKHSTCLALLNAQPAVGGKARPWIAKQKHVRKLSEKKIEAGPGPNITH